MKKILLLLFTASIFSACNTIDGDKVVEGNTWKLIETRLSIGGPAEYVPADRDETIEFIANSKVRNNNGWCGEGSETVVDYSENGTIHTNCNGSGSLVFEIKDGFLILRNPDCIEACDYKYEKVGTR